MVQTGNQTFYPMTDFFLFYRHLSYFCDYVIDLLEFFA